MKEQRKNNERTPLDLIGHHRATRSQQHLSIKEKRSASEENKAGTNHSARTASWTLRRSKRMRKKIEDADYSTLRPDLLPDFENQEVGPFDPTLKPKEHVSTTPTVSEVDWYLDKHLGLTAADLGDDTMSLQGRTIKFYTTCDGPLHEDRPTTLFLSLVHGNEVVSLLFGGKSVLTFQTQTQRHDALIIDGPFGSLTNSETCHAQQTSRL